MIVVRKPDPSGQPYRWVPTYCHQQNPADPVAVDAEAG
jgi:hypothetical protein